MRKPLGFILLAVLGILSICLTACPPPFDAETLSVLEDLSPPEIIIDTPLSGEEFQSVIQISGRVIDTNSEGSARNGSAADFIDFAEYDILDSDPSRTPIVLAEDGSFSVDIPSITFSSQITVVFYAADINGNEATTQLILVPDSDGPFVTVTSPVDYGNYATLIEIAGTVTNAVGDPSTSEVNAEISYRFPGTSISGTVEIDPADGIFSITVDVSGLSGDKTIEITAADLNGNETSTVINITKPTAGGDIAGFSVTPGNKQVTISWGPVPYAQSYSLFEANYGQTRTNVTSPYVWDELENGKIYSFQLTANVSSGSDAVSNVVEKMPLSVRTLAPWVREVGYKSVTIEWRANPNVAKYTVERGLSPDGPWEVRRKLLDNVFTDTEVEHNTEYYYRVTPAAYPDVLSDYQAAVPGRFSKDIVTSIDIPESVTEVIVHENYAYASTKQNGLVVIDITDPENPGDPIYRSTPGEGLGIALQGSYAYIADRYNGLSIIDITDPKNPGAPVNKNTNGEAVAVAVSGSYVYVADKLEGLAIIYIQDSYPINPGEPFYVPMTDNVYDVAVDGTHAFTATGSSGLGIIDISDPQNPGTPIYVDTSGNALGVYVVGGIAYVAGGSSGLAVIDVSDPTNPGTPVYQDTEDYAANVHVEGSFAYIADVDSGIAAIDITNPDAPGTPFYYSSVDWAANVHATGNYLYVCGHQKLYILDRATPIFPDTPVYINLTDSGRRIDIFGNYAYVAAREAGLAIIDISDPDTPVYVPMTDKVYDVAVAGTHAFTATASSGLGIIDISDPENPGTPIYCETMSPASGVAVSGSYALVCLGVDMFDLSALALINISDPTNPGTPNNVILTNNPAAVDVSGQYAYVAVNDSGLAVIDISDPENPGTPVYEDTTWFAKDISVVGSYAYIANHDNGLAVIDISEPMNPGMPLYTKTSSDAFGIDVAGPYAFLGLTHGGLGIIDVSDPANPYGPLYPFSEYTYDVTVHGCYAYMASSTGLGITKLWEEQ